MCEESVFPLLVSLLIAPILGIKPLEVNALYDAIYFPVLVRSPPEQKGGVYSAPGEKTLECLMFIPSSKTRTGLF